jgi:hypothetical protein
MIMSPSVRAQVSQRVRDITPAQRLRANKSKFFRSPHGYLARFVLAIRPIVGGLGPAERAIGQHFQPLRKMLASVCACRDVPKPSCYGEAVLLSPRTADAACSTEDATFSEKDTGADSPAPAVARRDSAPRGERPKRVSIAHYDGGVVESYYIVSEGMVVLCDLNGSPLGERRRFAIGDNEEKIAQALLRQRWNLPETDFGRPLPYSPMGRLP